MTETVEKKEWEEAVQLCKSIIESVAELPERVKERAAVFTESVGDKVASIQEWIEEHEHVTEAMQASLHNMQAGGREVDAVMEQQAPQPRNGSRHHIQEAGGPSPLCQARSIFGVKFSKVAGDSNCHTCLTLFGQHQALQQKRKALEERKAWEERYE